MLSASHRHDDIEELQDGIAAASKNFRKNANKVKADVRETAETAREDAEVIARQVGRHVRELTDNAEEEVLEFADAMSARIQDRPLTSIALAGAVGLLLGAFFRRA